MTTPPDPLTPTEYYRERLTPSPAAAAVVFLAFGSYFMSLGSLGLWIELGVITTETWLIALGTSAFFGLGAMASLIIKYDRAFVTINGHGIHYVGQAIDLDHIIGWEQVSGGELRMWRRILRRDRVLVGARHPGQFEQALQAALSPAAVEAREEIRVLSVPPEIRNAARRLVDERMPPPPPPSSPTPHSHDAT